MDLGTLAEGNANNDLIVDLADVVQLSNAWMTLDEQAGYSILSDFDRNDQINLDDLLLLVSSWMLLSPIELP